MTHGTSETYKWGAAHPVQADLYKTFPIECLRAAHSSMDHLESAPVMCDTCLRGVWSFRNLGGAISQHDTGVTFACDAAVVSPVFFGYTSTTEADVDAENAKVRRQTVVDTTARVLKKDVLFCRTCTLEHATVVSRAIVR